MPKLIHIYKERTMKEYALQTGTLTIGRHPDCYVQIADDNTVSGHHAQVMVEPSEYMEGLLEVRVEDLNSTNGTKINGRKIKKHLLKHGETVRIGSHEFMYVDENSSAFEKTAVILPEN